MMYCVSRIMLAILLFSQSVVSAEEVASDSPKSTQRTHYFDVLDRAAQAIEEGADLKNLQSLSYLLSHVSNSVFGNAEPALHKEIRNLEKIDLHEAVKKRSSYCSGRLREELEPSRFDGLVSLLRALLSHEDPSLVAKASAILLGQLHVNEVEDDLLGMLAMENCPERTAAMILLGRRYHPDAVPVLKDYVYHMDSPEDVFVGASKLLPMGERDGVWAIRELATTPNRRQANALECLVKYGNEEDIDELFRALLAGKLGNDGALVFFDLYTDAFFFGHSDANWLVSGFTNPEWEVTAERKSQFLAYWDENPPVFSDRDRNSSIRNFIDGLEIIGGKKAANIMAEYLFDREPEVARLAMINLGGLPLEMPPGESMVEYLGLVAPYLDSSNPAIARSALFSMERLLSPTGQRGPSGMAVKEKYGSIEKGIEHRKKWWAENAEAYPVPERFASRIHELPLH